MNLNDLFDKNKEQKTDVNNAYLDDSISNESSKIGTPVANDITIESLRSELETEKTAKLRYLADYQNLLKQSQEKISEARLLGNTLLISKLLELYEDFERGLDHIQSLDNIMEVKSAFDQIVDKLKQIIQAQDLEEVACEIGDAYNPETMEAISVTNDEGKVTLIAQKGFKLKSSGKIVRPAKVIL